MGRFSLGVDIGSSKTALSVYDHERQCATAFEVGDDKTMPSCVFPQRGGSIVGKRAETRSAKQCDKVLCAHRRLLYSWVPGIDTAAQDLGLFHFATAPSSEPGAPAGGLAFDVKGEELPATCVVSEVMEVVCSTVLDAAQPGGLLQVFRDGSPASWVACCLSVPEFFPPALRDAVVEAAREVPPEVLSRRLSRDICVFAVSESLAAAVQVASLPPHEPRSFMLVDFGASRLSVVLYHLEGEDEGEGAGGGGIGLREVASASNVFACGDAVEHRVIHWCERRKPFQESMIASKPALFKLRREVRSAVKTLTVAEEAMIEVDSVVAGHDLLLMLTLEDFERECEDLFDCVPALMQQVVGSAGTAFPEEVVLVGGATRIPCVQRKMGRLVAAHGATIKKTVDLDRAVSQGLATVCAVHFDPSALRVPFRGMRPLVELADRAPPSQGAVAPEELLWTPAGEDGRAGGDASGGTLQWRSNSEALPPGDAGGDAGGLDEVLEALEALEAALGGDGELGGDGGELRRRVAAKSAAVRAAAHRQEAERRAAEARAADAEARAADAEARAADAGGQLALLGAENEALRKSQEILGAECERLRVRTDELEAEARDPDCSAPAGASPSPPGARDGAARADGGNPIANELKRFWNF